MPRKGSTELRLKPLSPAIHSLLASLRGRIRLYVLVEGIATAVVWLILTFWAALALDYLPVLFGFRELSTTSRAAILVLVSLLIAWVVYRLILRRIFVRLKNRSMALLIERRYPQFNDSLLTTVHRTVSGSDDGHFDESMLARTRLEAESHLADVDLSNVVNSKPLGRSLVFAGALLVSVVAFAIAQPAALKIAGQRLYLLQETAWPRRCRIEMVGVKLKRENPIEGIDELGQIILPKNGEFRVAKGSTLTLMVRAEGTKNESQRRLPDNCTLIYRNDDGNRGVQTFKRIGAPRDGFQLYSLDGQPLQGILSDLSFDIRGGDFRLGPFKISVVDEPSVIESQLACRFPEYIRDESSIRWTDRTIDWSGQARLPEGTGITIKSTSNKELTKVYAFDRTQQTMQVIEPNGKQFEYEVSKLDEKVSVQFYLCDADGLVSEQPHAINIDPIEDQPPIVQTSIVGIGTAVTPDVQIPFSGSVEDDYGVKRSWIEIEISDGEFVEEAISIGADGKLDAVIDFKQRRQDFGKQYELPVAEESTLSLVIKSEDKFDLRDTPNRGIGDRYTLDLVTPNQLVRILERLEIGQRRRLEQIYLEMADARNYLVRSKSKRTESSGELVEPGDRQDALDEPGVEDDQSELRKQELRLLFAQRAILQVDKSTQEILGSAEAFNNIRLQLINNRIDSEDRKKRFSEQIIAPLQLIGNDSMRQLRDVVLELESGLRDLQISPGDEAVSAAADQLAVLAIEQADIALNQLDEILNALIKYETQNELLEIVRQMIKQQQLIMERTKKERQRKAFEGLLD